MKKFRDVFEVNEKEAVYKNIADYDAFPNKVLLDELRIKIIENLIDNKLEDDETLKDYIYKQISESIEGYDLSNTERNYLYNLTMNEISAYGPLTDLMDDDDITEIMVNGENEVYVEINGKLIKDETVSFINADHIVRTIEQLIRPIGKVIDREHPMIDARLKNGARINAMIPPLSKKGPIITIRKLKKEMDDIEDLLRTGTLTPYMARFLEACVQAKINILVVGGNNSGRTTLLNVLANFIDDNERIITLEEASELKLDKKHVVSLETALQNNVLENKITMHDLLLNALNMRPDRLIVSELTGSEVFNLLQAMNTGNEGVLTSIYANSPSDALNRLITLAGMNGTELNENVIKEYINGSIEIIVQIKKLSDGRRKITNISELEKMDKNHEFVLKDIFAFNQKGLAPNGEVVGEFVLYDYVPKVYKRIKQHDNIDLKDIFE